MSTSFWLRLFFSSAPATHSQNAFGVTFLSSKLGSSVTLGSSLHAAAKSPILSLAAIACAAHRLSAAQAHSATRRMKKSLCMPVLPTLLDLITLRQRQPPRLRNDSAFRQQRGRARVLAVA